MIVHADLQYYAFADSVTLALPNVAEGDLVLIIDYAHGGIVGGRNGDRLVPVPDTDWTSYRPGAFNGAFSSYARMWPAGGAQSLDLASEYASDRIVAVVVLRYASSDPNDWVFSARHTETVDQYFETPSANLPRSGYQVGFAAERAFPSNPVFSGTPFTAPTGLERLGDFDGAGVRLKGVLGGAPAPAGPIGGAEADAGEFRVGGGWEFTFGASDGPAPARVRSTVSEDAGSLFQATQAVAVELGISEAFEYGTDLGSGLRAFREALTPDEVAVSYYPLPTRNQEMLTTVEGETNLGRLASTYPAAIMLPATVIPGASGGVVTAQQAIQHVTNQWASEHPWLSFAPIPDLRLMVPSAVAAPRQHYIDNPGDGVLTTAAVVIPQEGNERRSMREILDEWLAIFPGTIVRQTSTGVIELVPRVGPDAPSGAAVTLTWGDLTGISDGEDDPSGVTNRCRVTSQGWEFTPNQALIAPSFVLVRAANGVTRAVLDGENVLPTDSREEHSIYDDLVFTGLTAPTAATVDVVIRAYGSWSPTTSSSFSLEGTATRQVTLAAGQAQDVSITHNSRSQNVTATFRLRRSADGGRIAVSAPGGIPESAGNPFGRTWFAYVLDVDVTGTAWVRSNERVESEFGQTGTTLPGAGGGDALSESRALYGERLAVINSNVFQLTPEQAQLVARSYVLANINPRTIRDVQQSEWDLYPVKFDHIGRLVDLPTGERAVIENRSYNDSFSSTHGAMTSSFSASVTEIVIDTTTDWLLLDNGDFMQLDSGTLLEAS